MIDLADPALAGFIEDEAWAPLADVLIDRDITLSDLAVLYAGTPPAHQDGLHQECVAAYLGAIQGEQAMESVRSCRVRLTEGPGRGDGMVPVWMVEGPGQSQCFHASAPAVRALKRLVLALSCFAGVRVERCFEISWDVWNCKRDNEGRRLLYVWAIPGASKEMTPGDLGDTAIAFPSFAEWRQSEVAVLWHERHEDRRIVFKQTLTAPQLIWPESAQGWPTPAMPEVLAVGDFVRESLDGLHYDRCAENDPRRVGQIIEFHPTTGHPIVQRRLMRASP